MAWGLSISGAAELPYVRARGKKGRKQFFFEKKDQETFICQGR
jgi:hypothetical protein